MPTRCAVASINDTVSMSFAPTLPAEIFRFVTFSSSINTSISAK